MTEFKMPSLGADMQSATLVEWRVSEGDRVSRGDIIAGIETEKGDIDVEVWEDGVIEKILVQPGQKLPVGAVMAIIRTDEGQQGSSVQEPDGKKEAAPETSVAVQPTVSVEDTIGSRRIKASPLARKMALSLGIDLNKVTGSGYQGIIHKVDVERAVQERRTPPPPKAEMPASPGMRLAIAAAMSRSNREIPHYYLESRVNMEAALLHLEQLNSNRPPKERILPVGLMIKASALALAESPLFNGYWIGQEFLPAEAVNVGFAISLRQGGLVIATIRDADLKSPDEIRDAMNDLILRARGGKLRSSDLSDSTVTLTSMGDRGAEAVFGVIYPPQVALLGFGKIQEQAWAENGMIGVKPILRITLAADHRASDGIAGSKLLERIEHYLLNPNLL